MSDIKEITEKIKKFCKQRNWHQFHNPKDMAISLCLEANEILEHFQWLSKEEAVQYAKKNKEEIGEELADVAKYLFELSDDLGIDLASAIEMKMKKDNQKYPIEKSFGRHTKYTKLRK